MYISKIYIENFKLFKGSFGLELNQGINILVGNNDVGKSTIIEAIHLALTGFYNGKYLKNELSQYIFNKEIIDEYIESLKIGNTPQKQPHILIEIFISGEDLPLFEGNENHKNTKECGFSFRVEFDENYKEEYESLIKLGEIETLPIEYYKISWSSCARQEITPRIIPIKSALIDSSSSKFQNGSDVYISRIIKELLETKEVVEISQAHRKMKEHFTGEPAIEKVNKKIKETSKITEKSIELSVELSSKNAWESSLVTNVDDIPFHFIGKGEQSILKTQLALNHKKTQEANIVLLEEPENHLSYSKLNQLISAINEHTSQKQILISTHSSFVLNKLGVENLILLNDKKTTKFNNLSKDTYNYFKKLSGYNTLRLILCKKAILVEGDSDELIIQKAFMLENDNKLPIEKGIDVISVGTSFLRFLEIAEKINTEVVVVTDNDGNVAALNKKYKDYLGENKKPNIKICFDKEEHKGNMEKFNYNTLEPAILRANNLEILNKIFGKKYKEEDELLKHMEKNKTECALKIFETDESIKFSQYILGAIGNE